VPAAVAAHHLRVDRIHLVASGHQRPDQQPPVGLDPHRDPPGGQHGSVLIQQAQVMVAFAPVHPKKQHGSLLLL
jgi:hypothetical protein